MQRVGTNGLFTIGGVLLVYVFTAGEIWNNHSVQSCLLLCTGVMSVNLGLLALALRRRDE